MRHPAPLILPLFLLALPARAETQNLLPQVGPSLLWLMPYAWPQTTPPHTPAPTLPAFLPMGSFPLAPDPRLGGLASIAQPQAVETLLRLTPLLANPPLIEGMLKLASVAADPRTAEVFMKLAAALADPRTLETLSRLITAMSDPRLGEAVAVLADPKVLGAVVNLTTVFGSALAGAAVR